MPFKSKAQMRWMFANEGKKKGLPKGTAKKWADHTDDISELPEKKASFGAMLKDAICKKKMKNAKVHRAIKNIQRSSK